MKKFLTLVVALALTIPMMAVGRNDGSTKANAKEFDWEKGVEHTGGTLWYRVDLAPLYEEENPAFTLYLTNPSNAVGTSVDVSMEAAVAGQTESKNYTIAARQYKTWTANASTLVRMKQTEIYLTLTTNGKVKLSAKVFEAADLDETCKDARTLSWGTATVQAPSYSAWWKVSLTPIKEATNLDAKITITNTGANTVNLKVGQSLDCPSSGLTRRTFVLAPGESTIDTVPRSMIASIQPNELYFGIENVESQVTIKVETVAQPPVPVIGASDPFTVLHVTDTIRPLAAGATLYRIKVADMDSLTKYEPEFTYRNEGTTPAKVTVKMAFEVPAYGTSNAEYNLAPGEEEIVVYKKNMFEGMKDVEYIYLLTIVEGSDVNFYGRFKHVREGKACKTNIDYNWDGGHLQEARTTQWYAVDLSAAKAATKDVIVHVKNVGDAAATAKASVAFSCPYYDLQELSRTIGVGDTASRRIAYSTYAMMSDTVWFGVTTNQDIKFWAETVDAEKKAIADTLCLHAIDFNWEEGVVQNAGDTVWYRVDMTEVRDLAAKFPTIYVQNLSSTEATTINAELSLDCPDSLANDTRSLTIAANDTYSKKMSRNMFENIKQDIIYVRVVSTQQVAVIVRLTEESEGASCSSAIPFNWVSGNTQAANANLWYAVDLRDVMTRGNDIIVHLENRDGTAGKGVLQLAYECPVEAAPSVRNYTLAANETRSKKIQNSALETLQDSIVYINVQGTTGLRFWADTLPVSAFDTIYATGLTLKPLQWDTLYTQTVDTAWYILTKSEIEKVRNLPEKVKPVGHLINLGTAENTFKVEAAYAFPIVKNMMSKSQTLAAGLHFSDTIPASTFDQILKKDSIILRITRSAGAGDFQFRAELVKAFRGNTRNDALPIRMGELYTQAPMTSMWYKINTADLKKDQTLYNKALNVMTKNVGTGNTKIKLVAYEGLLSEEELFEKYGLADYRERTVKKGQGKSHNIPAQAVYALGDVELYVQVTTTDSIVFESKFVGEYAPQAVDPKQAEAILVVPNVDYVVPGDNQEHWYQVCIPYIRNNYKYVHAATLTYELTGTATIEGTATFQDAMDCQMPIRKRTINKSGTFYQGTKPLSELLAKGIRRYSSRDFDITTFQEGFIDEMLRHYGTSDSITGYVRIKTDQDLKVRLNIPQTTGDQCTNPMMFDWEHGNVNPAGADTWYLVKLDSTAIPDTCDLRIHVDNWSQENDAVGADLYFGCNEAVTASKNYNLPAGGKDSIDVDRDLLQQLGWDDMLINFNSDKASYIWAELIPSVPRDTLRDTIVAYVCQGGSYLDTITGITYDPVEYSMEWSDTVTFQDGVVLKDSVTLFQIHPLVSPEALTIDSMNKLGAAPLLAQGMQLFVDSSNTKLTEYYRNIGNTVDTVTKIDTVYWAKPVYKANGDLNVNTQAALDLTSYYQKTDLTDTLLLVIVSDTCGFTYRKDYIFPIDAYKYTSANDTVCPSAMPAQNPDTIAAIVTVPDTLNLPRYIDTIVTYYARIAPTLYADAQLAQKPIVANGLAIDTTGTLASLFTQFSNDATPLTMKLTDIKWQVDNAGTWQDMPYTVPVTATSVTLRYVVTTECGDVLNSENIVYPLAPCVETTGDTTAVACETFAWRGKTFTVSGNYKDTLVNFAGCDSIVTLHLTINQPNTGDTTAVACETFTWHGKTFTTTGNYNDTLVNVAGCDSIVTLHLTINQATTSDTTAVACESFAWHGKTYTTTGNYNDTLVNVAGCDSIITLHLTINQPTTGDTTAIACESFAWHGKTYTTTGNYNDTLVNVAGCDSIITLHLTINQPTTGDTTALECDKFTWHGTTYTASGDYQIVLTNIAGCDSTVTLHLTIRYSTAGDTTAVECDEFTWYGTQYTTSGNYTHVLTNAAGCDSTLTLHLTINNSVAATPEVVSECNRYTWHGVEYTTSGTYKDTLVTATGCDSICELQLTIATPYLTTLQLIHKFGDRLLMINRNEINAIPGWSLDSLDIDHPEYVTWYEIDPEGNEKQVGTGYTYNLPSGEPLPAGYTYYAVVTIPASAGATCGAEGTTVHYTIPASAAAPALVPSLARPGQDIQVINLDPTTETRIRIYSAEGLLQKTYIVSDAETFTIQAAYDNGFYLVELVNDNMKSTLRYIVK